MNKNLLFGQAVITPKITRHPPGFQTRTTAAPVPGACRVQKHIQLEKRTEAILRSEDPSNFHFIPVANPASWNRGETIPVLSHTIVA